MLEIAFGAVFRNSKGMGNLEIGKNAGDKGALTITVHSCFSIMPRSGRSSHLFSSCLISGIANVFIDKVPDIGAGFI